MARVVRTLVTPFLFGACIVFVGPLDRDDGDLRDLVAARARWNANGVTSYVVEARALCFCIQGGERIAVTVKNGVVTSATVIRTGQPVAPNLMSHYRTIEQLFDTIENAIQGDAYRIDATYHPHYGYPSHFFIDYDDATADEEFGYELASFNPQAAIR
jgi:hypothetical protein